MYSVNNDTEANVFWFTDKVFILIVIIFTHDTLVVLYLLQQNVLMQYSNNRDVFLSNNRNALFQYHPTLASMFRNRCIEY